MTIRELNRHSIIKKLIDKDINGTVAAKLLKLSIRQTKRLKARVKELGAQWLIHKGRIERMFNTFQDRLVKEMRLRGISTIKEANRFLEEEFLSDYAVKYGVEPVSNTNLHQPLRQSEKSNLHIIFPNNQQEK